MKIRILILWALLTALSATGQQLQFINRLSESPVSGPVLKCRPVTKNQVWITGFQPQLPTLLKGDSSFVFRSGKTGFYPETNLLTGIWKTSQNEVWMTHGLMPSFSENSNGGLIRFNPQHTFQLYNALQNVPLIGIKEKRWHCSVLDPVENRLWIGSDTGLRWVQLGTLQTGFIPATDLPVQDILLEGKQIDHTPVFHNRKYEWIMVKNNAAVRFMADLPSKFRLLDLEFVNSADTLVLLDSTFATIPFGALYRKAGAVFSPLPYGDSIAHFVPDFGGGIWTLTHKGRLARWNVVQPFVLDSISSQKATHLTIDSSGNIWWILDQSRVYRLNPVKAEITVPVSIHLCDSATWQFEDASASINGAIQSRLWHFGDGQTSTEANPRHRYEREGLYTVTLRVTDVSGSEASTTDTVLVTGSLYLSLKNRTPVVSCQPVRLEAYGTSGFHWTLPGGSRDTSYAIMATQSGVYKVSASTAGCTFTDSVQVTLQSGSSPIDIRIEKPDGSPLEEESTAFFPLALSANAEPVSELCAATWKLDGRPLSDSLLPIVFTVAGAGTHVLEVNGYNYMGCPVTGKKEFALAEPFLPTLVTANGDGKNDRFEIPALRFLSENSLTLYNRWGQEVFTASPYRNNWPEGDTQPGTYFYRLEAGGKSYTGWVLVAK